MQYMEVLFKWQMSLNYKENLHLHHCMADMILLPIPLFKILLSGRELLIQVISQCLPHAFAIILERLLVL